MKIGLIGRKRGMTRVFTEEGQSVPVTVVEVDPNRVTQVKNEESDGYRSVQITFGKRRANLVNKPVAGHFAKAGVEAGEGLWEPRLPKGEGDDLETGSELDVTMFEAGEMVDVTGTSKGKKMAGHMGDERVTSQNLEIVRVDSERNIILIKGAVPGAAGGAVMVRPAVKTAQ